jgi:hypothetical protein
MTFFWHGNWAIDSPTGTMAREGSGSKLYPRPLNGYSHVEGEYLASLPSLGG